MKIGKDSRVLVTGGAGFIGSHLVDVLLDRGCSVTVLDNFATGKKENLSSHLGAEKLKLVRGDVCNPRAVNRALESCDVIFHMAAVVGVKQYVEDPLKVIWVNVFGTHNVLEAARRWDVDRVVFASTSEVYGRNPDVPLKEDADRVLGPTGVDRWSYATSKAIDEHACFAYHRLHGLRVTVIRYFNAYGPKQECSAYGSVVSRFVAQALMGKPLTVFGDGRQTRCFTYISDIVDGTMLAAESEGAVGDVFNLGREDETSVLELAQSVIMMAARGKELGLRMVPYKEFYGPWYEDVRRRVPDIGKARKVLGYEPQVELGEGLGRTIEWYEKNPRRLAAVGA